MKKEDVLNKIKHKYKTKHKFNNNDITNDKLKIIGITGSHGKSSIAYLLNEYLKLLGFKTVLYSSIMIDSSTSIYINNTSVEVPIKDEIMLAHAIEESINSLSDFLILEINESTISKGICEELDFDIKVLTNIEPLENQMFEDYVELKKSFIMNGNHLTIIGLISDITIELFKQIKDKDVLTYSSEFFIENKKLNINDITYYLKPYNNKYHSFKGLEFEVVNSKEKYKVDTNLNMPFHGINITCLITIINSLNLFDKKVFKEFIKNVIIPGRDEVIKYKNGYIMISSGSVPQLEVLSQYRKNNEVSKITLVTGTTGNIFPTWNELYKTEKYIKQREYDMNFAYKYAIEHVDKIIITVNDPGYNDVDTLLKQQENIVKDKINYQIVKSRKDAIISALDKIETKEVIFISGRGNRELMCSIDGINKHSDKRVVLDHLYKGDL